VKRVPPVFVCFLVIASISAMTFVPPASADAAPDSIGGFYPKGPLTDDPSDTFASPRSSSVRYYYNAMVQGLSGSATGAVASLTQAKPVVAPQDSHSLTELAIATKDHTRTVEVGWTVDRSLNKDAKPHIFVYATTDYALECYNKCGFVRNSSAPVQVGQAVPADAMGTFAIQLKPANASAPARWAVFYNGISLGYYPIGKVWKGTFNKFNEVQAFGEVLAASSTTPQSQMGNGVMGNKPGSAAIKNVQLTGVVGTLPNFQYRNAQAPAVYKLGNMVPTCKTKCGMTFGGPGY
jgi:hypothetical protein